MNNLIIGTALLALLGGSTTAVAASKAPEKKIVQGEKWLDTSGLPINAHGAGMLYHNGKYYLYGEYKKGETILPDWATWECYRTDEIGRAHV